MSSATETPGAVFPMMLPEFSSVGVSSLEIPLGAQTKRREMPGPVWVCLAANKHPPIIREAVSGRPLLQTMRRGTA
jgi:hypothetical protein